MKNAFTVDAHQTYFALLSNALKECGALFFIFLQIAVSAINRGIPKNIIQIIYAIKNAPPQNCAHNQGNLRAFHNHTADHIAANIKSRLFVRFSSIFFSITKLLYKYKNLT